MKHWIRAGIAIGLALALMAGTSYLFALDTSTLGTMAMIAPLIVPRSLQQLKEMANPQTPGQSEVVPWIFHDTQTFASAATTRLNFFTTQQATANLSNLQQAGALTDPQWFEVYNLGFDLLIDASTAGAATEVGAVDDIQKVMLVGQPVFTIVISDKNYGPFILSPLHTSGGVDGGGYGLAAAADSVQWGNNSYPDGGWNWRGSVIIPPKVSFRAEVVWAAAQTLRNAEIPVRFWMAGALHRRIL